MTRNGDSHPYRTSRSKLFTVFAVLLMIGGSLVATSAPAGAEPGNLADIDVADIDGRYVVAALTTGGTIQVEVVTCLSTCTKHGWSSLGGGFKSVNVEYLAEGRPVVIARRNNGATWYKRGSCSATSCSWISWKDLGGSVIDIATSASGGNCVLLAGKSATKRVYQAKVCANTVQGWGYTGGQLDNIAVSGDRIFGTTSSQQMWWYKNGLWKGAGGNTIEPAAKFGDGELCGLSQSSRKLWCVNTSTNKWTNHGGYWRKLDDDRTIGIGGGWDAWVLDAEGNAGNNYEDNVATSFGGKVNEVAWTDTKDFMVGIGSDYRPWYQDTLGTSHGTWATL